MYMSCLSCHAPWWNIARSLSLVNVSSLPFADLNFTRLSTQRARQHTVQLKPDNTLRLQVNNSLLSVIMRSQHSPADVWNQRPCKPRRSRGSIHSAYMEQHPLATFALIFGTVALSMVVESCVLSSCTPIIYVLGSLNCSVTLCPVLRCIFTSSPS
jgi:hypothetical protein